VCRPQTNFASLKRITVLEPIDVTLIDSTQNHLLVTLKAIRLLMYILFFQIQSQTFYFYHLQARLPLISKCSSMDLWRL